MNSLSGVNASGPLISRTTSISSSIGYAPDRVLEQGLEARPVLLEQLAVEVGGDPVERPRRRVALVAAHDQAARLGPEVDEQRGVAHRRHVERETARAGDQVLVRHRHDRYGDAGETAELRGEHPARVDDDLRLDRAAVGLDAGDAASLDGDAGHARRSGDLGAAPTRALGERERELARVDVAVGGKERRAEHALGRHRGEERLRLLRRDQLERQPEGLRPAGLARDLLESLLRGREPQRADLAPAGLELDLLAERAVELDRAHHHPGQAERAAQLPDEAGGVERGAARQVGTLEQDRVRAAQPGEPVEHRAAADAAADHHHPGALPHGGRPYNARWARASAARKPRSAAVRPSRSKCSSA